MQIIDSSGNSLEEYINFSTFQRQVPKALHTSLCSTWRNPNSEFSIESLGLYIAVINLVYIIMVSSLQNFPSDWRDIAGIVITFTCIVEMILVINPCNCFAFSRRKFSGIHDGLALLAALASLYGTTFLLFKNELPPIFVSHTFYC